MKKFFILVLFITNFSFSLDIEKGKKEISRIKRELVFRYKRELQMDFRDMSKNTPDQIRVFNETLYLKFLSKYIKDIKDVKIYKSQKVENILIFSDENIDDNLFDDIYNIFSDISKIKVKLIQVPKKLNQNSKVIKEQSERRQND